MKKLLFIYLVLISVFVVYFLAYHSNQSQTSAWNEIDSGLQGGMDEKYVMITFLSGMDYWKNSLKGFEDAAQLLNVSVEYHGATKYDIHEQVTVLEQVIARKPAGIAITAMDPKELNVSINKAITAGIPVVLFDSGAPESAAYSFLGTDNYKAGVTAAHKMAELIGNQGQVAVISQPNQLNHQERFSGFEDTMKQEYTEIDVVILADGKGDQLESREQAIHIMDTYLDLAGIFVTEANGGIGVGNAVSSKGKINQIKIISFDTDKGTLDLVRDGVISATLAQGTWSMGYWSLQYLFHLHHDLAQPVSHWKEANMQPLPRNVDTGISIVTKDNVDNYYAK